MAGNEPTRRGCSDGAIRRPGRRPLPVWRAGVARAGGRSSWQTRCGCGDKHSFGPGSRAVKRLNGPMAEEPQAPSAWAFAVGLSILTLREPAAGVRIMVIGGAAGGRPNEAISHAATTELATNKLFQSAIFSCRRTGWWDIEATVDGERVPVHLRFDAEAADQPPSWQSLAPWVSWPALAVLLFAVHQWLVRRKALGPKAAAER